MISESESKVRVFSPFPKLTDVNLTGVGKLLARAKIRTFGVAGMPSLARCAYTMINETYVKLLTQLKDRVNLIKLEMNQATEELETLADVMQQFLPKKYQKNMATLPGSRRFIGAVAALGAGAGLILGDPLKEAACTAVPIFNLCDDTSSLSKDVEDTIKTQKEAIVTFRRFQSANDENCFLSKNEVQATQENVKNLRDAVNDRLQTLDKNFTLILGELTLYKECAEKQAKLSLFLRKIRHVITHLSTLYTHTKSYQAAFYAQKINLFSKTLSLASGQNIPQFLLPEEIADIAQTLSKEEI